MGTDICAKLRHSRVSPRKMRLVARLLPGMSVVAAENMLAFLAPKSSDVLLKLLRSAMANAKHNFDLKKEELIVKDARVNEGIVMKRYRPRARGVAFPINKRTSHIDIVLTEKDEPEKARVGKRSEIVTKKVEELTAEELSEGGGSREGSGEKGKEGETGGISRSKSDKSRQMFRRRSGEN